MARIYLACLEENYEMNQNQTDYLKTAITEDQINTRNKHHNQRQNNCKRELVSIPKALHKTHLDPQYRLLPSHGFTTCFITK